MCGKNFHCFSKCSHLHFMHFSISSSHFWKQFCHSEADASEAAFLNASRAASASRTVFLGFFPWFLGTGRSHKVPSLDYTPDNPSAAHFSHPKMPLSDLLHATVHCRDAGWCGVCGCFGGISWLLSANKLLYIRWIRLVAENPNRGLWKDFHTELYAIPFRVRFLLYYRQVFFCSCCRVCMSDTRTRTPSLAYFFPYNRRNPLIELMKWNGVTPNLFAQFRQSKLHVDYIFDRIELYFFSAQFWERYKWAYISKQRLNRRMTHALTENVFLECETRNSDRLMYIQKTAVMNHEWTGESAVLKPPYKRALKIEATTVGNKVAVELGSI